MKKFIAASLALGAAIAFIPSALADSFGYKVSGSTIVADPAHNTGPASFADRIADTGTYTVKGDSRALNLSERTLATFGPAVKEAVNPGLDANIPMLSGDSGFLFDNVLYPGTSENGTVARGDVLIAIGGHELNLFSGHFGDSHNIGGRGNSHFYFTDGGSYRISNEISKGSSDLAAVATTLAATPEPGSLLLLGTGLLCLALFLFRKAAKHTTGS